ncbi:MAG TPA: outer membrane beta-barrel protein [Vicinamibacterales bacterium]|nr:outer membrane beta-barrel protein [Vicinamibacterales bacterium]
MSILRTVCVAALLALAAPAYAQLGAPPRFEVFGGYSLLPANGDDFPRATSHGVQAGGQWNLSRWFGVFGEAAVQKSTARDLGPGFAGLTAKTTVTEYLWGPRVTWRGEQANAFVHGLFGTSIGDAGEGFEGFSDNGPTFGFGGGVDVAINRRFAVRGQFDLIGSFADIVEGNSRLMLGGVFRF